MVGGWSSVTPLKAARGKAAAHHAQRVALVGRGPAAQVVVYFLFLMFYLFCFYFALNFVIFFI
jgi:hypothetical protein